MAENGNGSDSQGQAGIVYSDTPEDIARLGRYEDYLRLQARAEGMTNEEYLAELDAIMKPGDGFDKAETSYPGTGTGAGMPEEKDGEGKKKAQANAALLGVDEAEEGDPPNKKAAGPGQGRGAYPETEPVDGTPTVAGTAGGLPEDVPPGGGGPDDPYSRDDLEETAGSEELGAPAHGTPAGGDGLPDGDEAAPAPGDEGQPAVTEAAAKDPDAPEASKKASADPDAPEASKKASADPDAPEGKEAGAPPGPAGPGGEEQKDGSGQGKKPVQGHGTETVLVGGGVQVHEEAYEVHDFLDEISVSTGLASSVQTAEYIPPREVTVPAADGKPQYERTSAVQMIIDMDEQRYGTHGREEPGQDGPAR